MTSTTDTGTGTGLGAGTGAGTGVGAGHVLVRFTAAAVVVAAGERPWSQGGSTTVDDGILLCPWHHHRAHDPGYTVDYLPTGKTRFHRRT